LQIKQEVLVIRPRASGKEEEAGSRKQEAGSRKQEAGKSVTGNLFELFGCGSL
jgi:hypothetical protein